MKRILFVLLLAVACLLALTGCCFHSEWYAATCTAPKTCVKCGEVEGEALGHSWVEATCTSPKSCTGCSLTEGEALGHSWVEATTETPKTCTTCAATEGERIITDPRFTTASTEGLYGSWSCDYTLDGLDFGLYRYNEQYPNLFANYFEGELNLQINMTMLNDGTIILSCHPTNMDEFARMLEEYLIEDSYQIFAESGYTQEEADAIVLEGLGMSIQEYSHQQIESIGLENLFQEEQEAVYYVEDGVINLMVSWTDSVSTGTEFFLAGDMLTFVDDIITGIGGEGAVMVFYRDTQTD